MNGAPEPHYMQRIFENQKYENKLVIIPIVNIAQQGTLRCSIGKSKAWVEPPLYILPVLIGYLTLEKTMRWVSFACLRRLQRRELTSFFLKSLLLRKRIFLLKI